MRSGIALPVVANNAANIALMLLALGGFKCLAVVPVAHTELNDRLWPDPF